MSYPGGKSGAGVYQRLINEIPPHSIYIAGFAGHDAIAQHKKPAARNILIDQDPEPLEWWAEYLRSHDAGSDGCSWELHHCSAFDWLRVSFGLTARTVFDAPPDPSTLEPSAMPAETSPLASRAAFLYLDPPYLMSTRTSGPMYRHELTEDDHLVLLDIVKRLPCNVMLCGYWSDVYADALSDWRSVSYTTVARSGEKRTEHAWCNYDRPKVLHDSRYVGNDKREREKVRRRIRRLSTNLRRLPAHERQAVLDAVGGLSRQ